MAASSKPRRKKFDGPTPEEAMVRDLIELLEAGSTPWRRRLSGKKSAQGAALSTS